MKITEVHNLKEFREKLHIKRKISKHKDGTDIPKSKWGTKQGNWQKVHPLDR